MENARQFSLIHPLVAITCAAWLWLAMACSMEWSKNANYSHGWIVLPLAVYFLGKRLSGISGELTNKNGQFLAWILLAASAALVLPIELGRQAPLYWRVFPWGIFCVASLATLACAYLAGGRSFVVGVVFPLIFLASGIPWPTAFEQPLALWFMHGIASFLSAALPMAGIPAQQEGTTIVLMNCTVGVEEACSGLRSLQSAVMLALAAGEIFSLRIFNRILLLIAGFVFAIFSNAGRTLALTVAGMSGGTHAMEKIHAAAGLVALVFLAVALFALGWWMRRTTPEQTRNVRLHPVPWKLAMVILAIALASFFTAEKWYDYQESRVTDRVDRPLFSVKASADVQKFPIPSILQSGLSPDVGSFVRLVLPHGASANGFHFFWKGSQNNAAQLYHRPDACMPEGGWIFVGPASQESGMLGNHRVEWTALPYIKSGRYGLLLWASWVDGRQIPFSVKSESGVQRNNLWHLILNGRRTFSYETVAVLVPYNGGEPPIAEAIRAASVMFLCP